MTKSSTGIWMVGAFPKYLENKSALIVALINISRKSGRFGRGSRNIIKRKSSFIPLSWISSTNKWLTPVKLGSWTYTNHETNIINETLYWNSINNKNWLMIKIPVFEAALLLCRTAILFVQTALTPNESDNRQFHRDFLLFHWIYEQQQI